MFWFNCANVVFSDLKMQWFWNHLCGSQNTLAEILVTDY